ncbi:MAG: AMP-binding protein, partial [Gammaproteobacteria bacterium]
MPGSPTRSLHGCVEAFAASRANKIAIADVRGRLTYAQLNARANRLAHALIDAGVGRDAIVGLSTRAGVDTIVGMLGIMKAGGAYLPLDPDLPNRRLARITAIAEPMAIVADEPDATRQQAPGVRLVRVDAPGRAETNPGLAISAAQLCYVMFTSGSAGEPKGVMVSHGNLERLFEGIGPRLDIAGDDIWSSFHTCAFGFSVWEIRGALCHGGSLVMVPPALRTDPRGFARLIRDEGVSVVSQTPSAFRQNFLDDGVAPEDFGSALRAIVLSGEAAAGEDIRRWFSRAGDAGPALFNKYAITETSGQLTVHEYGRDRLDDATLRSVGRPLPHAELHILDERKRPVRSGEVGELFVAGPGVA